MSKSKDNFYTLKDITETHSPLAYRYLVLNSHYRSKMNFSEKAMQGAENSLRKMRERVQNLSYDKKGRIDEDYKKKFLSVLNDDLNSPRALEVVWTLIKDNSIDPEDKKETILDFDRVLGLELNKEQNIPKEIEYLAEKRKKFRENGQYEKADEMRKKINESGYKIEDVKDGYKLKKI